MASEEEYLFKSLFYGAGILKIAVKSTMLLAQPTKIYVPKKRGHLAYLHRSPENYRRFTWAAGFPVSTSHFAVIGIPPTARYALQSVNRQFNCLLCPNIRDWPHRREPYARSEMMPVHDSGGGWTVMQSSTVHCPLSRFFEYPKKYPFLSFWFQRTPSLSRVNLSIIAPSSNNMHQAQNLKG
jgi:hypothetical protein